MRLPRRGFLGLLFGVPGALVLPWPRHTRPAPVPTERLFWLNPKGLVLQVNDSDTYAFGFTGFKPGDEQHVSGSLRWQGRVAARAVRQLHGVAAR